MQLKNLSAVRLLTDRYRDQGVAAGATGTILDVYDDAYEVEFSRSDGSTIAWFAVRQDEVSPTAEPETASATRGRRGAAGTG